VYERAREYRREVLTPAFFACLADGLGDQSEVLLLERQGNCLAFALLLTDGDLLAWTYCGLDYRANGECDLYFNLLYEIVFHGIRRGVRRIDLGITTLDAKKRVGAEVRPLHMYMRHRNPLLRPLAPSLFRLLTPGDASPLHRVFRTSEECGE
jgi:predicted N-acyltransferase